MEGNNPFHFNFQALEGIAARGVPMDDMIGHQEFENLRWWLDVVELRKKFNSGARGAGWEMKEVRYDTGMYMYALCVL